MSWLYERKVRRSEKNGKIVCQRLLGRWEVFVGDIHMSSRYLRALWRDIYASLPKGFTPKRILMLGLAAGDNVALLARRFPDARVTAVEWDPEMVRLADELGLYRATDCPEVVIGDAREFLRAAPDEAFDLILVDIFTSKGVSPAAYEGGFFADVRRALTPNGYVAVNAFREPALLDLAAKDLREFLRWKHEFNRVGIFAKNPLH